MAKGVHLRGVVFRGFFTWKETTMSSRFRVLALHAHPDDVEFQCAGTLALLREAGCEVTIATMTPGDCGSAEHDCRGDRGDPPRRGPRVGGPDRGGVPLPGVPRPGDLQRRRFAAAGHRGAPPDPARHHPDGPAGRLPLRSRDDQPAGPRRLLRGVVPQLRDPPVGAGAPARRRSLTSTSSIRSKGSTATGARSRSTFMSTSRASSTSSGEMLACHASQRNWLLRQHGIDEYLESQAKWGAHRGAEIGVAQAEAFRQYRGHPYPAGQPAPEADRPGRPRPGHRGAGYRRDER